MNEAARKAIGVLLGLITALMLIVTLTVPAIAAAGPAILTIGFGVMTWAVWPKRKLRER